MEVPTWLLAIRIDHGPVLWAVHLIAVALVLVLLIRRPTRRWLLTAPLAVLSGALLALAATWLAQDVLDVFDAPMERDVRLWIAGTGAVVGLAIANLWLSRWWRKLVAVLAIAVFVLSGALGVASASGIAKNVGDLLEMPVEQPLDVSSLAPHSTNPPGALAASWTAPPGMPTAGIEGTVTIPATTSGFPARDAIVYLPPAARLPDAPALPVVVFMSGQPGAPDVSDIGASLDAFAAQHEGLAPIVVSVDQLGGDGDNNPLCIDGYQGNAQSYVDVDVPAYIAKTFNVLTGPANWTIAGFSNGGGCAIRFAAAFPELWGNVIDIAGELGPDLGSPEETIDEGFGGDSGAYEAAQAGAMLAAGAPFPDTVAIFADGTEDEPFLSASRSVSAAAAEAGMRTSLFISPGTGHDVDTIAYGFDHAFPLLYPRWGLASTG